MSPLCEKMILAQVDPIMRVYGSHISATDHLDLRNTIVNRSIQFDVVGLGSRKLGYVFNVRVDAGIVKYTVVWEGDEFVGTKIELLTTDLEYSQLLLITVTLMVEIHRVFQNLGWDRPENMMQTVGY